MYSHPPATGGIRLGGVVAADVGDAIRIDDLRGIKIPYYDGNPSNLDEFFSLRHGGPPPKALHQSGLNMGRMSVHGEPKFSEGQPRVFTNLVKVKTLHELHHGPEKVKIPVEAISVKDAKGYIAYTKAK